MQKLFIPALLALSTLFNFSCSSSNSPDNLNNGEWVVSYFLDSGDKLEDTGLFAGYSFDFNGGDQWIIHLPGGNSATGKWLLHENNTRASLAMENPFAPVETILGEWDVIEQTSTGLQLRGRLDVTATFDAPILHFQKQ